MVIFLSLLPVRGGKPRGLYLLLGVVNDAPLKLAKADRRISLRLRGYLEGRALEGHAQRGPCKSVREYMRRVPLLERTTETVEPAHLSWLRGWFVHRI